MIDWLIDWLTDWLSDCLTDWLLAGWLAGGRTLTDWAVIAYCACTIIDTIIILILSVITDVGLVTPVATLCVMAYVAVANSQVSVSTTASLDPQVAQCSDTSFLPPQSCMYSHIQQMCRSRHVFGFFVCLCMCAIQSNLLKWITLGPDFWVST